MLDDDRVRSDLDLFDHQPEDALAIGHIQGWRRRVELGEKALKTSVDTQNRPVVDT